MAKASSRSRRRRIGKRRKKRKYSLQPTLPQKSSMKDGNEQEEETVFIPEKLEDGESEMDVARVMASKMMGDQQQDRSTCSKFSELVAAASQMRTQLYIGKRSVTSVDIPLSKKIRRSQGEDVIPAKSESAPEQSQSTRSGRKISSRYRDTINTLRGVRHIKKEKSDDGYESDKFFSNCFNTALRCEGIDAVPDTSDIVDPDYADEYYLILDRPYRHSREDDVDELRLSKCKVIFNDLKEECKKFPERSNYSLVCTPKYIRYLQLYETENPVVKTCLIVNEALDISIKVHNKDLSKFHDIWRYVPDMCFTVQQVMKILDEMSQFEVCSGNSDKNFVSLVPPGAFLDEANEKNRAGYNDVTTGVPTIRAIKCPLLVKISRCAGCSQYRGTLRKTLSRKKNRKASVDINFLKSCISNNKLSEEQKMEKIRQLKDHSFSLAQEVEKLQRQLRQCIKQNSLPLSKGSIKCEHAYGKSQF